MKIFETAVAVAVIAAGGRLPAMAAPAPDYHTYETLTTDLQQVAASYPSLARLTSLGHSVQGRELWMMKITRNPDVEEDEPEVRFIAAMHGDEVVGKEMCVNLIHLLTESYGTDPRITALVDTHEIWILPSMNPDGTVAKTRANANGVDLNRDFPDQFSDPIDSTAGREPETAAVMNWGYAHSTNLSANLHGGASVVRYPFDSTTTGASVYNPAPDDPVLVSLARTYANANPDLATSNFDTNWDNGIANGAAWLPLNGGMQDWNYVYRGGREMTIELSDQKWPASSKLAGFWADNRESMLAFLERSGEGVRGIVRDAVTGAALLASIRVVGQAGPGSATFTDPDVGDYHRMLLPGRYDLEISAAGHATRIVSDVVVPGGPAVRRDVALDPTRPSLAVTGFHVIGGTSGDGAFGLGDTAGLRVSVRNLGSAATGISARLVPAGTFATIGADGVVLPDLAADASADALAPDPAVTVAAGTPAGHKFGFALAWSANEGSGVTEPFYVPVGQAICTDAVSADVPKAIPDRVTVNSTISYPADREISELDVYVDIAHPSAGELTVSVLSPGGTPVALRTRSADTNPNILGWFDTTIAPSEPLSRFQGESSSGAWQLSIRDGSRANTGTLNGWTLRVCGRPFEAEIPELLLRDVVKGAGGAVSVSWWPYPRVASYRVSRSTSLPPAPGTFADVTGEDGDPNDTRFDDHDPAATVFWLVSGAGTWGATPPPSP